MFLARENLEKRSIVALFKEKKNTPCVNFLVDERIHILVGDKELQGIRKKGNEETTENGKNVYYYLKSMQHITPNN